MKDNDRKPPPQLPPAVAEWMREQIGAGEANEALPPIEVSGSMSMGQFTLIATADFRWHGHWARQHIMAAIVDLAAAAVSLQWGGAGPAGKHVKKFLKDRGVDLSAYKDLDKKILRDIIRPAKMMRLHTGMTASEAVAVANSKPTTTTNIAKEFLTGMLAGNPTSSSEVEEAAKAKGISRMTLFRAKKELKIVVKKDGELRNGNRTWRWHLSAPVGAQ